MCLVLNVISVGVVVLAVVKCIDDGCLFIRLVLI